MIKILLCLQLYKKPRRMSNTFKTPVFPLKQQSVQSESSGLWVQDFVWEMEPRASHQDTSDTIMVHSSEPQEVSHCCLGLVGERMLWDWFQPERNTV